MVLGRLSWRDMPEPCKFPSLENYQKKLLWTHKEADVAQSASRVHGSQPQRTMEVTRDLLSLNLLTKLMVLHRPILFSLAIVAIAEPILIRTSAEQVPSLHRVAPRYLKQVTSSNFWPFMLIICSDDVHAAELAVANTWFLCKPAE